MQSYHPGAPGLTSFEILYVTKKKFDLIDCPGLVLSPAGRGGGGGGGYTRSIHDRGSDVFFWVENLHARYFFGSRDLSLFFRS